MGCLELENLSDLVLLCFVCGVYGHGLDGSVFWLGIDLVGWGAWCGLGACMELVGFEEAVENKLSMRSPNHSCFDVKRDRSKIKG